MVVIDEFDKIKELSSEYRKEKDASKKVELSDELFLILEGLKKDAISKFKDESDIKRFLDNLIMFHKYSYNNQLLIWKQNPNATYVAPLRTFNKMGYKINKGAKSLKIFRPNFLVFVKVKRDDNKFDVVPYFTLNKKEKSIYKDKDNDLITFDSQKLLGFSLECIFDIRDTDMPIESIEEELNPTLDDARAHEIKDCFIKTIYNDGFKVQYKDLSGTVKGYRDMDNNTIVIRKGLSDLMQMKVLIHEYAHGLAHHHLKGNNKDYQIHRNKYETEAESISYVVSKYLGLKQTDFSLSYLYAWSKEKDFREVDDSLGTIVNYSKRIIKNYEKFYDRELGLYAEDYKKMGI